MSNNKKVRKIRVYKALIKGLENNILNSRIFYDKLNAEKWLNSFINVNKEIIEVFINEL